MNILGRVQPNKDDGDFLTEEELQGISDQRIERPKPKSNTGDDLMKMLGNMGKQGERPVGEDNPNGGWEYTNYDDIKEGYVPISKTYKPLKYEGPTYETVEYESPTYEPATQMLFGEQGKSWENSPVFKETGIGKILRERGDHKSVFEEDKELKDILFGGEKPADDDLSGRLFGMSNRPQIVEPTPMPSPMSTQVPSMAEIMAKVNLPQIPNVPPVLPTPIQTPAPMPIQPIYNRPQPIQVPMQQEKRKGGRPKGSKNRPPPGGPWQTGINQTR